VAARRRATALVTVMRSIVVRVVTAWWVGGGAVRMQLYASCSISGVCVWVDVGVVGLRRAGACGVAEGWGSRTSSTARVPIRAVLDFRQV
jgi:hypothetical protein